jgi:hypothetical protein
MKKPLPSSAAKKPSSGFKPFISPYRPQAKNPIPETPTKRPINEDNKPSKVPFYIKYFWY